jgi:hypothetical protein
MDVNRAAGVRYRAGDLRTIEPGLHALASASSVEFAGIRTR